MGRANKQKWTDAQWRRAFAESSSIVSISRLNKIAHEAKISIISNYIEGQTVIGWSGGKDSLVIQHLCDSCLKNPEYLMCTVENQFIEFVEWKKLNSPKILFTVHYGKMSAKYLNEHEDFLFPETMDRILRFNTKGAVYKWMLNRNYTKIVTGKRTDDGNNCGSFNANGCKSTTSQGIDTLNIISDWTIYELFAYMRYFNIELPPQYYYPNGFKMGSNEWTKTRRIDHSYRKTFDFIAKYAINDIIKGADDGLIMAKKYLRGELHD